MGLILTRYPGQIIDITLQEDLPAGTHMEIRVVGNDRGTNECRLDINAPRSVRIDRREITVRRELEEHPELVDGNQL